MKTAFIAGLSGQDGAYLSKLLLEKGYRVIGGVRRSSHSTLGRLAELGVLDDIELCEFDLSDYPNVARKIKQYQPDELYNLAA